MSRGKTPEEFKAQFISLFGDKWLTHQTRYKGGDTEVALFCKKHGKFKVKPRLLFNRTKKFPCPACSWEHHLKTQVAENEARFWELIETKFSSQPLDFTKTRYTGAFTKVSAKCELHGDFQFSPHVAPIRKKLCPRCARSGLRRLPTSTVSARLAAASNETYSFDPESFSGTAKQVTGRCKLHGVFFVKYNDAIKGIGCPKCSLRASAEKRTLITRDWVKSAREIHGMKYRYHKSVYVNAKTKLIVTCRRHGEWSVTPTNHVHNKRGCPRCSGRQANIVKPVTKRRVDQAEFLRRAEQAHPEQRYSYAKSVYRSNRDGVIVTCRDHGDFTIRPHNLWRGGGCPSCAKDIGARKRSLTKDQFVSRSKKLYEIEYDYSFVRYKNAFTAVTVVCPVHGKWRVLPSNHLAGTGRCPGCRDQATSERKQLQRYSKEDFVVRAREKFGDTYDYDQTIYKDSRLPIAIRCREHGNFTQKAYTHLSGKGCKQCGEEAKAEANRLSPSEVLNRFDTIHFGKYVYPAFTYESQKQRIAIQCPTHGIFRQQIGTHLQGKGCPKCSGSKGEAAISRWLSKNGFEHEAEYKVRMKNSRNPYRFDFYLPDRRLLIEYDGEQHFRPVTFGGMSESEALKVHNQIKRRDKKKNVWAKENGFALLRVRYDEDVEHVLEAMVK